MSEFNRDNIYIAIVLVWAIAMVVLGVLLAFPAHAEGLSINGQPAAGARLLYMPPPTWHGQPVPTALTYVPAASLPAVCNLPPGGLVACARRGATNCTVYIAKELTGQLLADTLRHEEAHCSGWHHAN